MFRTLFICMVFFTASIYSSPEEEKLTESEIKNLIGCIESDNAGVCFWGVFFAGKYNINEAVDPLIKLFHESRDDYLREIAVHSLFKIGNERGLNEIRKACKYEKSAEIRNLCKILVRQLNQSVSLLEMQS